MAKVTALNQAALTDRQNLLLTDVVEEYLKTARPVASQELANAHDLSYSSATIRNELLALEEAGYLEQPHTSAGRIPTVKAWREYLKEILPNANLAPKRREALAKAVMDERRPEEDPIKALARTLADFVG